MFARFHGHYLKRKGQRGVVQVLLAPVQAVMKHRQALLRTAMSALREAAGFSHTAPVRISKELGEDGVTHSGRDLDSIANIVPGGQPHRQTCLQTSPVSRLPFVSQ